MVKLLWKRHHQKIARNPPEQDTCNNGLGKRENTMKIERFRTADGIKIRAGSSKHKALFNHCAGADSVSSRHQQKVHEMLFIHGVKAIETTNHKSI